MNDPTTVGLAFVFVFDRHPPNRCLGPPNCSSLCSPAQTILLDSQRRHHLAVSKARLQLHQSDPGQLSRVLLFYDQLSPHRAMQAQVNFCDFVISPISSLVPQHSLPSDTVVDRLLVAPLRRVSWPGAGSKGSKYPSEDAHSSSVDHVKHHRLL